MSVLVFAGGGSGGHIFPGLAIIDQLAANNQHEIIWIGSSSGIDRSLVEAHGTQFYGISSGKFRRYFSFHNVFDIFKICSGFVASIVLLLKLKPVLVFSKGGFVSVPPCLAARLLRIPVITHECDFSPGLATKINAMTASDIFVSYDETRDLFPYAYRSRITVTGNPVRTAFYSASSERGRTFLGWAGNQTPILFIQGGSLGARQLNSLIALCIDALCSDFLVIHQIGAMNMDQAISTENTPLRDRYKAFPFIGSEMPDVLAAASIVIARSGANTVWECATVGKPMVLFPLDKGSSRGDQIENAQFFVTRGAAVMLTGADATSQNLLRTLGEIWGNAQLYADMAANSAALGKRNPAEVIANRIRDKLSGGST